MALELIDFRMKITAETHCYLVANARAHDGDKFELARNILHDYAMKEIHGATLLANCLRAKGLTGADGVLLGAAGGKSGSALWSDDE